MAIINSVTNAASGLNIGQYLNPSMLMFFVFILILGYSTFWIVQRLAFKMPVEIYSRRGGGNIRVFKDRGKYAKDIDGVLKFKLMKAKTQIKPPNKSDILITTGLFGSVKEKLQLVETDQSGFYIPLRLAQRNGLMELTPDDVDVTHWAAHAISETHQMYSTKSWIEKYGGVATIFAVSMFCIVIMIFMSDWTAKITAQNLAAQEQIARAISTALTVIKSVPPVA